MLSVTPLVTPRPAGEPYVLLVDDHEECLRSLRLLVESAGYAGVPARSAREALLISRLKRPAAVVTDFRMPRLDGLGLARLLKRWHETLPIVLVTADGLDTLAPDFDRSLFAALLRKPLDIERFLNVLGELVPPGKGTPGA